MAPTSKRALQEASRRELSAAASVIMRAHSPKRKRRGEPKSVTSMRKLLTNPALKQPPRAIYVIGAETGAVKIGIATDVWSRLKTLQTGCPEMLRVYGVAPVAAVYANAVERQCHRALAKYHRQGEWFDAPPAEALDVVRRIAADQRNSLGKVDVTASDRVKYGWY